MDGATVLSAPFYDETLAQISSKKQNAATFFDIAKYYDFKIIEH